MRELEWYTCVNLAVESAEKRVLPQTHATAARAAHLAAADW